MENNGRVNLTPQLYDTYKQLFIFLRSTDLEVKGPIRQCGFMGFLYIQEGHEQSDWRTNLTWCQDLTALNTLNPQRWQVNEEKRAKEGPLEHV